MVDGSIRIFDPKTPRARREIALPAFTLPVPESRRRAQRDARRLAGMPSDEFDLVCDRGDGQPIDPSTFTHAFKRLAKETGIRSEVRLHDARHGVATAMLEHNVHPAIASAVLGHASESFTMSTSLAVELLGLDVSPALTEPAFDLVAPPHKGGGGIPESPALSAK